MPAACGLACEVCGIKERVGCPLDGCVAGTDPSAPEKLAKLTAVIGHPCQVLECAMKKKVDYCTRCDEFPCEAHYQRGLYNEKTLDMFKSILSRK